MKKQTKGFVLILCFIILSCVISFYFLAVKKTTGTIAKISLYGEELVSFDLSLVEEPFEYVIENHHGGENTLLISPGKIGMIHANCPDQLCIKRGFISNSLLPIVCLPNGITVEIVSEEDPSSVEIDTLVE